MNAGPGPYRVWRPDAEGDLWGEAPDWGTYLDFEDGEDLLLADGRREAHRDRKCLVAWGEDCGYLALARQAGDPPEPNELLLEDVDRYCDGELELRPTLRGGPPEYEEDDRFDPIHE